MSKILFFDIEWSPAKAYVWRMWDENVTPDQLIHPGGLLCFSAQWQGEKETMFFSEWGDGHEEMVKAAHKFLSEADAVVTFNGDKYDIPKLRGEFLLAGLPPVAPLTSIDLIKTIKKLGYVMNRLAFIGPFLGVGKKVKHEGFTLWSRVLDGDVKAQKKMERYCIQDTRLLVRLYAKVMPYIHNHPHLGDDARECGACGSNKVQSRGYRRTKYFKIQRLQCQTCGSWQDGKREKV